MGTATVAWLGENSKANYSFWFWPEVGCREQNWEENKPGYKGGLNRNLVSRGLTIFLHSFLPALLIAFPQNQALLGEWGQDASGPPPAWEGKGGYKLCTQNHFMVFKKYSFLAGSGLIFRVKGRGVIIDLFTGYKEKRGQAKILYPLYWRPNLCGNWKSSWIVPHWWGRLRASWRCTSIWSTAERWEGMRKTEPVSSIICHWVPVALST
jgi:hypothetical protein